MNFAQQLSLGIWFVYVTVATLEQIGCKSEKNAIS